MSMCKKQVQKFNNNNNSEWLQSTVAEWLKTSDKKCGKNYTIQLSGVIYFLQSKLFQLSFGNLILN
jgi:hypothetical protein